MRNNAKKTKCQWCNHEFARGTMGMAGHVKRKHPEVWTAGKKFYESDLPVGRWEKILVESWMDVEKDMSKLSDVSDPIRPAHYRTDGYEAKDILNAWFPTDPLLWNCGKYLSRAGRKSSLLEDLKKAQQYLSWAIEREEGKDGR